MKIINASYEILTDISPYGTLELEQIERAARTCYKSEDKITEQGESAKKLIKNLIKNGHEAMLEHSQLSVKFICDRGVSHELVRHRMASFAQESTRYCNYSNEKFGCEITVIKPDFLKDVDPCKAYEEMCENDGFLPLSMTDLEKAAAHWYDSCLNAEGNYFSIINCYGRSPQEARCVLPNSLKTEVVMTANYREWRHILKLRTDKAAHPQMRELMVPLLKELKERIPVIFDDIEVEE
jgi:thymidylate synthase (FAD)